jgi:hypothetical protein
LLLYSYLPWNGWGQFGLCIDSCPIPKLTGPPTPSQSGTAFRATPDFLVSEYVFRPVQIDHTGPATELIGKPSLARSGKCPNMELSLWVRKKRLDLHEQIDYAVNTMNFWPHQIP